MSLISYNDREIICKIVYYGPGVCGKTTNLQYIHKSSEKIGIVSKLISLETEEDRTIFFDLLPFDIGTIRGFNIKAQLYTVPGQVVHNMTRKIILKGVDGIVFVADSQIERRDDNIESLQNLKDNLSEYGYDLMKMPYALQLNKRDLQHVMTVEEMTNTLNVKGEPVIEAIALDGVGVFDTLKATFRQVMKELREGMLVGTKEKSAE